LLDSLAFLAALIATAVLIPPLARIAPRFHLIDEPAGRRLHEGRIPLVGGLAMGVVFLAAYAACGLAQSLSGYLLLAMTITLAGGLLDDAHEISSRAKFAFQIAAAAALVLPGSALLTHLGYLLSEDLFTLGRWSTPLTIFGIVGVTNALNMSDGMDGLAGSLALAATLCFGAVAMVAGNAGIFTAACITAGALLGFLLYNTRSPWRSHALVFMGDTGSQILGLVLAWFAITLAMQPNPAMAPISAVWILALPIVDTVTIMTRRVLRGKSPFQADREHLHHILLALGLSSGQIVALLFVLSLLLGCGALALDWLGVPQYVMFYAYLIGTLLYGLIAESACRRLGLRESALIGSNACKSKSK